MRDTDTETPGALSKAPVVQVPVTRVDSESTTHLPDFDLLGGVNTLVGLADTGDVNTPSVVARIKAGKIKFEPDGNLNTEAVIASRPDLFLTQGVNNPGFGTLEAAGIKVVADGDYLEQTPLGRGGVDQVRFVVLKRGVGRQPAVRKISGSYNRLVALAAKATSRPAVLEGDEYKGTWYAAGGNSYVAAELRDAGASYIFANEGSTGSLSLDIETILKKGSQAPYWGDDQAGTWKSLSQAKSIDPRYAQLASFGAGNVWAYTKDVSANGGNEYFEQGVVPP